MLAKAEEDHAPSVRGTSSASSPLSWTSRLELDPCVPPGWSGYEITYRHGSATYHVVVDNSGGSGRGVRSVSVDGRVAPEGVVELADDGRQHKIQIALGS